jgi:Right handed beta helix region
VRNCVIRNTGATGIALNAVDYVTAERNLIYHTGYNQGWSSGIALWYGGISPTYGGHTAWYNRAPGFHNFVVGNVVSGAYDNSRHHTDGNGIIVDGSGSIPPALVANNLVYENGGAGVTVYHSQGAIWAINNTAYANGLNLFRRGPGWGADYSAISSAHTRWIDNLAYGGAERVTHHAAATYNSRASAILWVRNIAYDGRTTGVPDGITGNSRYYRYVDPMFTNLPPLPSGSTPWANATPPWSIGNDFKLRPGSSALKWGVNPRTVAGMTRALAIGLSKVTP